MVDKLEDGSWRIEKAGVAFQLLSGTAFLRRVGEGRPAGVGRV